VGSLRSTGIEGATKFWLARNSCSERCRGIGSTRHAVLDIIRVAELTSITTPSISLGGHPCFAVGVNRIRSRE
jgi:hypothetical protein